MEDQRNPYAFLKSRLMIKWKKEAHIYEGKRGEARFFIFVKREKDKEIPQSLYILENGEKEKIMAEGRTLEELKTLAENYGK
jgi:hypothetical protein